ncbi:hypothetical protein C0Q70_19227 [Pomacea canaliculata]|uniref:DUF4461 domain-containing protein n=2 Tax=Pomacea canaliculata TaxID=400727 RepID=A0A2T7NIQ6_POMCA|nr:hypothetical protein C0Q70_19227 [Pomacea canaliculata]
MFRPIKWHSSYYDATDQQHPNQRIPKQAPQLTLKSWLSLNIMHSRKQASSMQYVQEDINRLCDMLNAALSLQEIRWDSVWGVSHFRGCLKSFYRLYSEHPHFIKSVLKDRKLVFSNTTGVSRLGEIILSSEDVPTAWMKLLVSVPGYDAVLERLPYMEVKLSELLNDIRVVRHERSHSQVMAEEYELLLNKLLNSLRRCQDYVAQTFKNKDLSGLEMVVEGESGPLALSSAGSFLIPASVPGVLVVDFISQRMMEAYSILTGINSYLQQEEECVKECMRLLELKMLSKDDSVTPHQMISCCQRLTDDYWRYCILFNQSSLRISHYYSVMQDGLICIPWNWVGDDT